MKRADHQVDYPGLWIDIECQACQISIPAASRGASIPCLQAGARKMELPSTGLQRLVDYPGLSGLRVRAQVEHEPAVLFNFKIHFIVRNAFYNLDRTH